MKRSIYLFVFCLACTFVQPQTLTLIPNPDNGVGCNYGTSIIYNNNILFPYMSTNNKYQLAKYDGTGITLIPNPDSGLGFRSYNPCGGGSSDFTQIYNSDVYFYYENESYHRQIVKYDGTSLTLIPNPDNGNVCGFPIVYNNALYCKYESETYDTYLLKYDGVSTIIIPNPDNGDVIGFPTIYNNELFFGYNDSLYGNQLAKYDGSSITLIPNPDSGAGFDGFVNHVTLIVYNNALYFKYQNASNKHQLAKYDGISITLIPNPDNEDGFDCCSTIFNNNLYFGYWNDSLNVTYLAKYNGTSISIIANPDNGIGFYDWHNNIIEFADFNNALYFQYSAEDEYLYLAKYDGAGISLIQNVSNYILGEQDPIATCNRVYFTYVDIATPRCNLAYYDGTAINVILNPDTGNVSPERGYDIVSFNNEILTHYIHKYSDTTKYQWAKLTCVTDINEVSQNYSFTIYPSPSNNTILIETTESTNECYLSIFNINGQEVIRKPIKENKTTIDINGLTSGVYFVKLLNDKTVVVKKIIKE